MDEEDGTVVVTNVYGDFCIRKARRKRQKKLIQEMMYDYANNTTLHGLPYTTRRGLTMVEKIFWLITFIVSVCLCSYNIYVVWLKWKNSPVIVTVSEHLVPVGEVPFPSVTVCPQVKCKSSEYNFTEACSKFDYIDAALRKCRYNNNTACQLIEEWKKQNTTEDSTLKNDISMLEDIGIVCGRTLIDDYKRIYPRNYSDSVTEHLLQVAPKYYDIFNYCGVRGRYKDCSDIFKVVITSEGICYNMNSLAAADIFREETIPKEAQLVYLNSTTPKKFWSLDQGYTNSSDDSYPLPGRENGQDADVQIFFKQPKRLGDESCNSLNSGFKVYVQHPTDLPKSSLYYYAVLHEQVSSMALSVSILNTSESLRKYSAEIRQCYFPDERYLKYFKIYTASNCKVECLTNITYKMCNCVGFSMPYEIPNVTCSFQRLGCMALAHDAFVKQESILETSVCRCLPACNSIDYEAEILKTNFNTARQIRAYKNKYHDDFNLTNFKFSKMELYFKRPRFVSMRRSEMFGTIDFLANCGGLLGLFMGFSFLSLVELFYFLTLRMCCTLKKDLEEEKKQNQTSAKSK